MAKKWSDIADTQISNGTDEFLIIQGGTSKLIQKQYFLSSIVDKNNAVSNKIDQLEELSFFKFKKVSGATTASNEYTQLNSLSTTNAPAGTYIIGFNIMFSYSNTGRSLYFRFSDDGGGVWTEVRKDTKDILDVNVFDYSYIFSHNGGDIDLVIEYKTGDNSDTLNVFDNSLFLEKKL